MAKPATGARGFQLYLVPVLGSIPAVVNSVTLIVLPPAAPTATVAPAAAVIGVAGVAAVSAATAILLFRPRIRLRIRVGLLAVLAFLLGAATLLTWLVIAGPDGLAWVVPMLSLLIGYAIVAAGVASTITASSHPVAAAA